MIPVTLQPFTNASSRFISLSLPSHNLSLHRNVQPFNNSIRFPNILASSSSVETLGTSSTAQKKKLCVVVKPMEKPRLVLKFIWMEKNIGIALDQVIPGQGTIPLSPYYFWPRKDAWEELKLMLESKPWISHKQMVNLLNQATGIINLWQETGAHLA